MSHSNCFKALAALILVFRLSPLCAQMSNQLSEYTLVPQRVYANPALQPNGKLNIGIPALSGFYAEHRNNWFRPSRDLVQQDAGLVRIAPESILRNIKNEAYTGGAFSMEWLHAGYKLGKHYFHFRAAEHFRFSKRVPRDIFALAAYGNATPGVFEDHTANFSGLAVNAIHYREYAAGYSMVLNEQWQFGLTAKFLYGMERVHTDVSTLSLRTDPLSYDLTSTGAFQVQSAGLYGTIANQQGSIHRNVGRYLTGLNNRGLAADAGVVYKPMEKLEIQVSAHNIGFIRWRSDVANYGTSDATFVYDGVDFSDFVFNTGGEFEDGLDSEMQRLLDELEEAYGFERTTDAFTTGINGFFRIGASYQVAELPFGTGKVWANAMRGAGADWLPLRIGTGYVQNFWNKIEAGMHLSAQEGTGVFFGTGLAANAGPVQLWCMVENLRFAALTRVVLTDENNERLSSFVYPENAGDVRIQIGMNLVFSEKGDRRKSRPLIR